MWLFLKACWHNSMSSMSVRINAAWPSSWSKAHDNVHIKVTQVPLSSGSSIPSDSLMGYFFPLMCCQHFFFLQMLQGKTCWCTLFCFPPLQRSLVFLKSLPISSVYVVALWGWFKGMQQHSVPFLSCGFGLIVSSIKRRLVLGCTWIDPVSCVKFVGWATGLLTKVLWKISIPAGG